MPASCLLLDPDLVIAGVSDNYLRDTMTRRADLVGRDVFAAFPENPGDSHGGGAAKSWDSLDRVRRSLAPDTMPVLKYDVRQPATEGAGYEARYWKVVNAPLLARHPRLHRAPGGRHH